MTSVIMIFEVTRDCAIIVPLMISNLISFFVFRRLQPEAIYERLSCQDGIHLPRSGSHVARSTLRVIEAMPSGTRTVEPQATIQEVLDRMRLRSAPGLSPMVSSCSAWSWLLISKVLYRAALG
jgi:CIC family chloride channel protein